MTAPSRSAAHCPLHPSTLLRTGSLPSTFGQELVRGLLNADATLAVPSASVAAHLLRGSPTAKARLLHLPVEAPLGTSGPLRYILPTLAGQLVAYFEAHGEPARVGRRLRRSLQRRLSHRPLFPQLRRTRNACAPRPRRLLCCWPSGSPTARPPSPPFWAPRPCWIHWWRSSATGAMLRRAWKGVKKPQTCVRRSDPCPPPRPPLCDDFVRAFAAVLLGECLLFCGDNVKVNSARAEKLERFGIRLNFAAPRRPPSHPRSPKPSRTTQSWAASASRNSWRRQTRCGRTPR